MGVGGLTHRLVAARAGVPLGATTYYFRSLQDLVEAALDQATAEAVAGLRAWTPAIEETNDLPGTLAELTARYLSDQPRAVVETELYLAAAHRPELRPIARTWLEGLVHLLSRRTTPAAARAVAMFLDGAVLHALIQDHPLDAADLRTSLAALLRTD